MNTCSSRAGQASSAGSNIHGSWNGFGSTAWSASSCQAPASAPGSPTTRTFSMLPPCDCLLLLGGASRCRSFHGRVHPSPLVVPVALEAVQELVAERGEALHVALAARRGRVDRAHRGRARLARLLAVRAAHDVEEVLAPGERLAHLVRLLDAVPHHRHVLAFLRQLRRAAVQDDGQRGEQKPHATSSRPTSRPSAYFTPTMRPFRRATSRNSSVSSPRAPNWLACTSMACILSSMVSVTST